MSSQWRDEQDRFRRDTERHQSADKSYLDEGAALLELASDTQRLFAQREPREKRRLLNFLLSNCTWKDGEFTAGFRQPFDMLAETVATAEKGDGLKGAFGPINEIWLPEHARAGGGPAPSTSPSLRVTPRQKTRWKDRPHRPHCPRLSQKRIRSTGSRRRLCGR
jgi:hypothetical protein